jgi:hypothetical protein
LAFSAGERLDTEDSMFERLKAHAVPLSIGCINALVVTSSLFAWRFAYFGMDDFNTLYWVRHESAWRMLWHNINPVSDVFRPLGLLFYWICWRAFDLHPLPYHLLAWALHAMNVVLLYALLSKIVRSRYAAAVGALLFGYRSNLADIFFSFGTIFELLACGLMFIALLVWCRGGGTSYGRIALMGVLFILAIKSKEMAITLPGVLLLYDVCLGEEWNRKRVLAYSVLAAIGLWFAYLKVSTMGGTAPDHPYYMDLSVLTFGRGYGWYFDRLYGMRLRWGAWIIASVVVLCWMLFKREKRGLFFLGYTFVTLMPVVFLVNHRYEVYWYIPFFGIAGLAAVLVDAFEQKLRQRLAARALAFAGLIVFVVLSATHYWREMRESAAFLESRRSLAQEYMAFVKGLQQMPQPDSDETVYYTSFPQHFDSFSMMTATQVVFHRTDVKVEIVKVFPDPCRYCLAFENGTLKFMARR